jgi:glycosyltransferase involved in cell wall biosynthesis
MVAPVSVCLIVKNEEKQIEKCLSSIRPHVKEICVVDTGSTDNTPSIIKKFADKVEVFTECNDDQQRIENFAQARQRSFNLATQPWVMWIDGDDEVRGAENLDKVIDEHDSKRGDQPTLVMFPYEYAHDEKGNVICYHYRERIVTPKENFKWTGPVHEVLVPERPNTWMSQRDDVTIVHRRRESGKIIESGRNLRILKAHFEKVGETDVRQLYYLGLEYGNVGDTNNSIKFHKRYVELSGWDDEKFLACLEIAKHYQNRGEYEDAIDWSLKASTVREGWAEAYFSLAKNYYFLAQKGGPGEHRNWERSVHFAKLGLQFPPTKTILFVNPIERDFDIHQYYNLALNKIGDVNGALDSVNKALSVKPEDENLILNKKLYEEFFARQKIEQGLGILTRDGIIDEQSKDFVISVIHGKATLSFVDNSGGNFNTPAIKPSSQVLQSKVLNSSKLDIVFYVGHSCESWTPVTMREGGIGGSETAVVEMGKRLAAQGHRIRVYGDCVGLEGNYDGVDYIHYTNCRDIECDVFITSRRPHMMDDEYNIKYKVSFCWVHDIHLGGALTHERALKIDRFLVLSKWHRDFFLSVHKCVHPSQVITTRNGIDLNRFNFKIDRNPHKAVYSSSPDRGLEVAMCCWPRVRESIPDAELHVFYGFKNWEVAATSMNDRGQLSLVARLKRMLEEYKKHGVFFKDRINQVELAKEFLSSGVWAYSTWFSETSCLTAMEAQAAGLRMVTSPIAALNETVGPRGHMIPGDWLSKDYQDKWVDAVVQAMTKSDDSDRVSLQQYAKENFGWDSLAVDWEKMLYDVIGSVEQDVVPAYKVAG